MSDDKMTWLEASQELGKLIEKYNDDLDKMAEECPNELKIAVTRWAMNHIVEHAKSGGSYRYLIYSRMGFGPEAYAPLLDGGMVISNEFDIEQMDNIKKIVAENKYDALKDVLHMCDEPDCYKDAGCGWPTEDGGYRMTCGKHYKK
jgi:hypothetical protein